MATDNNMEYDEAQAVKFIRDYMPADKRDLYDDDEIINIIDMIWDYYEDDQSPELPDIIKYVKKMLAKDKLAVVDVDDVHYIVEGELAYEKSIGALED